MFPSASLFIIPIGFPPPAPFPCCIARGFFASSQRRALRDAAFRDFERPALPGETRPDAMRSPLSADRPGARTRDTPDRVTRTWAPPRSAPPRASWTNLSRRTRTRSSDAYGSTGKREKLRRPRRPFESERKRKRGGRSSVPRQALHRVVHTRLRSAGPIVRQHLRNPRPVTAGDRFRGDFGANPPPRVRRGLRGGTQRQFVTGARGVRTPTRLHVCDRDERTARDWTPRERVG